MTLVKRILATLLPLVVVAAGLCAVVVWTLQTDRFPLRTIEVRSELKHVTAEGIKAVVLPHLAEGFFGLDVDSIQKSLKQIPWVQSVDIRRVWPDRLVVFVKEQIAQGRWNDDGILSTEGVIFYPTSITTKLEQLPKFIGEKAEANTLLQTYLSLLEVLAPTGLNIRVLEKKPTGVFEMRLDNGIAIILGKTGLNDRASRFVQIYRSHLKSQIQRIAYIDLRYNNGFAIGWKEGLKELKQDLSHSPNIPDEQNANSVQGLQEKPVEKPVQSEQH